MHYFLYTEREREREREGGGGSENGALYTKSMPNECSYIAGRWRTPQQEQAGGKYDCDQHKDSNACLPLARHNAL